VAVSAPGVLPSCIMRKPGSHAQAAAEAAERGNGAAGASAPRVKFGTVPGIDLLGPEGVGALHLSGAAEKVDLAIIEVTGQPFKKALRARVLEAGGSEWSVQLQSPTRQPVEKGDLILATFYLRGAEVEEGSLAAETAFVFERSEAPFNKAITYPIKVADGWRKIQIRFPVDESYPAGAAHVVIRLGYEPETLEIGGLTVESFRKAHVLWDLPTSEQADHRADVKLSQPPPAVALQVIDGGRFPVEVAPGKVLGHISPYVYGINSQKLDALNVTVRRMGGNRATAYNWETNASSAGSDYNHVNDDWSCTVLGFDSCADPGGQVTEFALANRKAGVDSIVTVTMSDYVSADKKGPVPESERAPSARYLRSVIRKPGPLSAEPDLSDGVVYQDEFMSFLVKRLGRADRGGIKFYSLDNEPALWASTHPRIHAARPTYAEVLRRSEATAAMITERDPSAEVLGGVMYGWAEYMSLQGAVDSAALDRAVGGHYIDFYLQSMKQLEARYKRRLVHVLDVHWYPEVRGTKRITEPDVSPKTVAARLEAPRSLWDSTYREKSSITDEWKRPIRLIPWLKETIARRYPGTKLSMTEYNFGAPEHVSGGLAQADVLGIFGREGLYLATYWGSGAGVDEMPDYAGAAFKLYRNYDGKGSTFGDTAVAASLGDVTKGSVYAAVDSKDPGRLTVVVINKSQQERFTAKVKLTGLGRPYASASAYVLGPEGAAIRSAGAVPIAGNTLTYVLPPLTATLFVCHR
jgi:hypothetical protein